MATNYSAIANLPTMGPGSTGASVKALQQWLVANGYMTQAQMNTGAGTYGPQTTAAVAAWQNSAGINTQGNAGYFGPISKTYAASQGSSPAAAAPVTQPAPPQTMSLPFTAPSNSNSTTTTYSAPSPSSSSGQPSATSTQGVANSMAIAANGGSKPVNASSIAGLGNMGPGSTGANVQQLQQWLVQNGYLTQAQMDSGPGTYGPQTTAAVAAWQKANNINTNGNPGYFGPISQNFLTTGATSLPGSTGGAAAGGTAAGGGASGGTTGSGTSSSGSGAATGGSMIPGTDIPTTGNSNLDSILGSLYGLIQSGKAVIPPGLQITPALAQQFLTWAHQVVDPQTQQLIQSEITNINASSNNLQQQYLASQGEAVQQFGTQLASQDNSAGVNGTAFSGLHNVQDQNLVNSTNRSLASLDANAAYNIGQGLRTTAADVGAANAGGINAPNLNTTRVGLSGGTLGGSQGSSAGGGTLDFSYNPGLYTAGTIPSAQSTAVSNLAGNYISQYGTLAGANSGKSISDLIGGVTGLPAGYTVPANLT